MPGRRYGPALHIRANRSPTPSTPGVNRFAPVPAPVPTRRRGRWAPTACRCGRPEKLSGSSRNRPPARYAGKPRSVRFVPLPSLCGGGIATKLVLCATNATCPVAMRPQKVTRRCRAFVAEAACVMIYPRDCAWPWRARAVSFPSDFPRQPS
jgi:hypothetical protein